MKHVRERRSRNRLLRGRGPRRVGGALTLRQQIGRVLGVEPQVYADARDLDLDDGDPVTVFGDFDQKSGAGTITYDADGWGGVLPSIVMPSNGHYFSNDHPEIENYDAYTAHVWAWSFSMEQSETNITLGGFGRDQENITNRLLLILVYHETLFQRVSYRIRESASNQDSDIGSAVPLELDTLMHLGVCHNGDTVTVMSLTPDGFLTHIDAAPNSIEADISFNHVHLGGSSGVGQSPTGPMALATYTRCSPANATPAKLQSVLNLHNQHYPVA